MVELKAQILIEEVHLAQILNYLRTYKIEIGLLINFGEKSLNFKRFILSETNNNYITVFSKYSIIISNQKRSVKSNKSVKSVIQTFTHLDNTNKAIMVDVSEKAVTHRTATRAFSIVYLPDEVFKAFNKGRPANKKRVTGISNGGYCRYYGRKKTGDLIPLCHPLGLDNCQIDIQLNEGSRR